MDFAPPPIYQPAWADPREAVSTVRTDLRTQTLTASLGVEAPILGLERPVAIQVSLSGAAWLGLRREEGLTFPLQTVDGRFGVPVDIGRGPWVLRVGWRHTSAHYADGIRDVDHPTRTTWSREEFYSIYRYSWDPVSIYAGASWLAKTAPELAPFGVQAGLDTDWRDRLWLSADLTLRAEYDWAPGVAATAGLRMKRGDQHPLRLGIHAYSGPSRWGQLQGQSERALGLMLAIEP